MAKGASPQRREKPPWRRILYEKQPYPDNYSEGFYARARQVSPTPSSSPPSLLTFWECVRGAALVHGQLDTIVLYLCCFEAIQLKLLGHFKLLTIVLAMAFASFSLFLWRRIFGEKAQCWDLCRTLLTVVVYGYTFTPIVRTLTTSISTDSIYASSVLLFGASLVFHDYGIEAAIVSAHFSLNLCLAASVFLISRVESDEVAFELLSLALCAFCFWPAQRNRLVARWPPLSPAIFGLLFPIASWLLWTLFSPVLALAHFALAVFIVLGCPWLFIRMQESERLMRKQKQPGN